MKHLSDLLLLGDPRLYAACEPVLSSELPMVKGWVADLDNVMKEVKAKYNFGRAIAWPWQWLRPYHPISTGSWPSSI